MPTITVEIQEDGSVSVAVSGSPGKTCTDITRTLEQALGETVRDTPTREMALQPQTLRQEQHSRKRTLQHRQ